MKHIVVLEDQESRIDFLRQHFPHYEIVWFADVSPFLAAVKEHRETLCLVVFDHDLGRMGPPDGPYSSPKPYYDVEGKTGADAAYEIEPFGVPALVWSQNTPGRETICNLLSRGRKASWIQAAPFRATDEFRLLVWKMLP